MPRQKTNNANSQEDLSHTWDTNMDKKQICKSVSLVEKKQKSRRLTDSQHADMEIWDTLLGGAGNHKHNTWQPTKLPGHTMFSGHFCMIENNQHDQWDGHMDPMLMKLL